MYSDIRDVEKTVMSAAQKTDALILPVRESLFKRFPTVSLLLVTFGVSATVYGIERLIADIPWLNERPLLIILMGVLVLVVTGRLYKKLG